MEVNTEANTEAAVITQLAKLAEGNVPAIAFDTADGRSFTFHRNDFNFNQITPANKAKVFMPKIVSQEPHFQNAASLIDYVNRFKDGDSVTFASVSENKIQTILDYHHSTPGEDQARLGAHVATLDLPFSEEWKRWVGSNEKLMSHVDFASYLEENSFDVVSPVGAELLEMCRDLQVKQDVNFSSSIRLGDTASISYSKEGDASSKNSLSLPVSFTISIPVYFGEAHVSISCFTRRQIGDGKLKLGYKMIRLEQIKQQEFARITGEVQSNTSLTTLYGSRGVWPLPR